MHYHFIEPALNTPFRPAFGLAPDVPDPLKRPPEPWQSSLAAKPPKGLKHLHNPRQFARTWDRLLALVRDPVQEVMVGSTRQFSIGGNSVVEIEHDRTMTSWLWHGEELHQPCPNNRNQWTVVLQGMPYHRLWLKNLTRMVAREVHMHARATGVESTGLQACHYAEWAFGVFDRQLRRHADMRQMRQRVASALRIDPALLSIAARTPRTTMPANIVVLGAYNRALRHRALLESLQREAPNLVPLYAALCDQPNFPKIGEPIARLRSYLLGWLLLSQRSWRMVANSNGRLLQPLAEFYKGDIASATEQHLRFLDLLTQSRQIPAWVIRAMLNKWGNSDHRWESYCSDVNAHIEVWRHVVSRLLKIQRPSPALLEEFDLVQRWITRPGAPKALEKNERHAGWSWMVRRATEWAQRQQQELQAQEGWPVPFDFANVADWSIVPLRNPFALWEEARVMRHCADQFTDVCLQGKALLLSVRLGQKRVATVSLQSEGGVWQLAQVKGFANTPASVELLQALERWSAYLTMQHVASAAKAVAESAPEITSVRKNDTDKTDESDDDAAAEAAAADMAMKDELVAWAQDGDEYVEATELMGRVEQWLERLNDEGNLSLEFNGQIILNHQLDNWRDDVAEWLNRSHAEGSFDAERMAQLQEVDDVALALTEDEKEILRELFCYATLKDDGRDADIYGMWGAEQVLASDGRSAWAVYRITGYSFTIVQLTLLGVCAHADGIGLLLKSMGKINGSVPGHNPLF